MIKILSRNRLDEQNRNELNNHLVSNLSIIHLLNFFIKPKMSLFEEYNTRDRLSIDYLKGLD